MKNWVISFIFAVLVETFVWKPTIIVIYGTYHTLVDLMMYVLYFFDGNTRTIIEGLLRSDLVMEFGLFSVATFHLLYIVVLAEKKIALEAMLEDMLMASIDPVISERLIQCLDQCSRDQFDIDEFLQRIQENDASSTSGEGYSEL